MASIWTERANAVEELLQTIPAIDAQKHRAAYDAAWELCEQLKEADSNLMADNCLALSPETGKPQSQRFSEFR
jgi:predicted AlkP superfamily pyrophosphatase or phosphodiesterase